MIMRQRQIDGLVETDQVRALTSAGPQQQEEDDSGGDRLKVPEAHRRQIKPQRATKQPSQMRKLSALRKAPLSVSSSHKTAPQD